MYLFVLGGFTANYVVISSDFSVESTSGTDILSRTGCAEEGSDDGLPRWFLELNVAGATKCELVQGISGALDMLQCGCANNDYEDKDEEDGFCFLSRSFLIMIIILITF